MTSLRYRKSTHSGGGNDCVEVAFSDGRGYSEWNAFLLGVKDDEFQPPPTG